MIESVKSLNTAMEEVGKLHESHGIQVKGGKKYCQVVHRVEAFRKIFGFEYGMETEIKEFSGGYLCKCRISGADGRTVASGLAFGKGIGSEKALEKIETTAVGRALANAGLGGGEYASINEMETFQERYEEPKKETKVEAKPEESAYKSAKSFQMQLINDMNLAGSVDELEVLLNNASDKIERLKTNYPELYEAVEHQENSLRDGGWAKEPVLKFASVADAEKFARERSEYLDVSDLGMSELALFENANMPYLISKNGKPSVLDKALSAAKYQKDGKSPSQRILEKFKFKLQVLQSNQG